MDQFHVVFLLDAHSSLPALADIEISHLGIDLLISTQKIACSMLDCEDPIQGKHWQLLQEADFIVLLAHGSISRFKSFHAFRELIMPRSNVFIHSTIDDEMMEILPTLKVGPADYQQILSYVKCRNSSNLEQMLRFIAMRFGNYPVDYLDPVLPDWEGLYQVHQDKKDFKDQMYRRKLEGQRIVGLLIPFYLYAAENLRHIDALIDALEAKGLAVIPVFTSAAQDERINERGLSYAIKEYFFADATFLPDVILNTLSYSMGIFENLGSIIMERDPLAPKPLPLAMDTPIIQAYHTYYSYDQWCESVQGLDAMSLISSVYYPEFDAQIDGYPIGYRSDSDAEAGFRIEALDEGIDTVASLADNWARLKCMPSELRKVAIIFHNMPPRNDMIGCAAGLDSPASVFNLVEQLRKDGVYIPEEYQDGDDIIKRIIQALSNDSSWLSDEEMLRRAVDTIDTEAYANSYRYFPNKSQVAVEKYWGQAPGTFRVVGRQMPISGILNGNLFIGLQPPRGYDEHADEIYHSTDISCPHYYLAFYKWIKYQFEADLIIHVGTHGSLEWLPGKEKALSKACFPQLSIDDIPHLYLYHTTVIGEGIQAKRRSAAVLLNHLEPVSSESGTYDNLAELDALVTKYISSPLKNSQLQVLEDEIVQKSIQLNLHVDLGLDEGSISDVRSYIMEMHKWLGVVKQSMVKDGLHIFGKVPDESRFHDFVRVLLRVSNGAVPSIFDALAQYQGLDIDLLRKEPNRIWHDGLSSVMVLDEFIKQSKLLIGEMESNAYSPLSPTQISELIGNPKGSCDALIKLLCFVADEVVPKLNRIDEELFYFSHGAAGNYVLPGKGGSPSRGNIDILPTGRNMYAIDPNEIPSRAAYAIAVKMGMQLLDKYHTDSGQELPESIAMVLYSGDQMRTHGEDIAEILWLMGLKPRWLSELSDRVIGLEVIPLSELGRPRLDVVCRISGLLRDTFPNLIHLLDEAVQVLIKLDEPLEMNYVKKHYQEDLQQILESGVEESIAHQEASVRVFGCPPGTYGGGVDILVENKNWQSDSDLATAAITWGGHAYTQQAHGTVCPQNFERQLSKVTLTLKNENTIDFDLFDIDDEFIYHGGLIAAVKKCSGMSPYSYYGNSSDPSFTQIRSSKEEAARVMRARLLNPKWIDGLKRHGYKGAQDVAYNMDNIFGWDATANLIEDWNYESLANHFLGNEENQEWMKRVNPWALKEIAEKMLEAYQRGMWRAKPETLEMIEEVYLECEGLMEGGLEQ